MKIIIGEADGKYDNEDVSKEFTGTLMAMVRTNGSCIVQNITQGIRPICYIGADANVEITVDETDPPHTMRVVASTDDGQFLKLDFTVIYGFTTIPDGKAYGDE